MYILLTIYLIPLILLVKCLEEKQNDNINNFNMISKGRYLTREGNGFLKITSNKNKAFILKGMSSSNFMTAPLLWYSETSIKTIKQWGANVLRICFVPTYWKDELEGVMKYNSKIDKYELIDNSYNKSINKLFKVVDILISNEIYVIVNWHTIYQGYYNKHYLYTHQDIAKKFFIDVSNNYPNNPYIIFEINNEDPEDWISISNYANFIIPSIREISPDSLIIVGTPDMDGSPNKIEINQNSIGFLNYDNLAYGFHIYPNGNTNWKSTAFEEAIKKDIPIIVTEWSSSSGANSYNEIFALNLIKIFKKYSISWCNYAFSDIDVNGNEFALTYSNKWDENLPDEILCRNGKLIKNILQNYEKEINIPNNEENTKILNTMISKKWDGLIWKKDIITNITSIMFQTKKDIDSCNEIYNLGEIYCTNVIGCLKENNYSINEIKYYNLYIQANGKIYANKDCSNLFRAFANVNYIDLTNFVITNQTNNAENMFYGLSSTQYTNPKIVEKLTFILGEDFNTSYVTNMNSMFEDVGSRSSKVTINLGKTFNTLRVKKMNKMFKNIGGYDKTFYLDLSNLYFDYNCSYEEIFEKWNNKNRTIYVKDEEMKNFILSKLPDNLEKTYIIVKGKKKENNKDIKNSGKSIQLKNIKILFYITFLLSF